MSRRAAPRRRSIYQLPRRTFRPRTNGEAHQRLNANGHPWQKPPGMHLYNFLWEIWWTDGDRPAVVTVSCHWKGEGGRHYLWIQGPVWAQMRAASLFT